MTLISISPDTAQIGWPAIIGYTRAGAVSVLNLFGLKLVRVCSAWAVTVG